MLPSLPQNDRFPSARRARLALDRLVYQYDRDYHELPFPLEWPFLELLPPRYYARLIALTLAVDANQLASNVLTFAASGQKLESLVTLLRKPYERELDALYAEREPPPVGSPESRRPVPLDVYDRLLPLLPKPPAAARWRDDDFFAWQRVAGAYPIALRLVEPEQPLDSVSAPAIERALLHLADTVGRAQAERRLFVAEYPLARGLPAGFGDGWRRFLPEVTAHFLLPFGATRIVPVAITFGKGQVFTPQDGNRWQTARALLQAVESTVHGVAEHGVACHIVTAVIALATYRCLGHQHPLRILLTPHFEFTIPVTLVTKSFFGPGGRTINLQSVSLEGCIMLAQRRWQEFNWTEDTVPRSIEARGLLDPEVLPEYPFRDDVLLLEQVISEWVSGYVRLYYDSPESMRADHELMSWLEELQAPDCAGLRGIPPIDTVEALSQLVTQIIHRATAYHTTINDTVYDAMGYVPNMPGAAYSEPSPAATVLPEAPGLFSVLPPRDKAQAQIADVFVVSNTKLNRLGRYPACTFLDCRVWPLEKSFRRELERVEEVIDARNLERFLPYRVLLPSRITASINV
jgi:arachidonate 15-lipoxygenase